MRESLSIAVEWSVLLIDWVAVAIIVYATIEVFVMVLSLAFRRADEATKRGIWLRYARWLVAGLTFLLAADIIETTITDDWESIARIAAIAVVRTFLNYFLERDVREANLEGAGEERSGRPAT